MVATHSPRGTNDTASVASRILYTYDTVMHGFVVRLTAGKALCLDVTSNDTNFDDGVIIGFINTGIWPKSVSFNDSGLSPIRLSWSGGCVRFNARLCNNKMVGAKDFTNAGEGRKRNVRCPSSPRDEVGHGTHMASTIAGSEVHNAALFTFSRGTARGVAPKARIAMYKACELFGYNDVDVVTTIDATVKDGVDIISISLDGYQVSLNKDSPAITTFGA
ncbi:hypothetical protein ABZP36_001632 [Zizania latifolia]